MYLIEAKKDGMGSNALVPVYTRAFEGLTRYFQNHPTFRNILQLSDRARDVWIAIDGITRDQATRFRDLLNTAAEVICNQFPEPEAAIHAKLLRRQVKRLQELLAA